MVCTTASLSTTFFLYLYIGEYLLGAHYTALWNRDGFVDDFLSAVFGVIQVNMIDLLNIRPYIGAAVVPT